MALVTAPGDEFLIPVQVAEITGLTLGTLANYRCWGKGPEFVKVSPGRGGAVLYRRKDVDEWLASKAA
ncbi:helix-turn-helix transcriptional regulator [Streptomyces sp. NPDC048594]|uniref:helix-turn-helix transcriptional regulator n=1 Tax=Streptomyces sp. NPDC048594 TaxID=3365575 RepID=UPI00371F6189